MINKYNINKKIIKKRSVFKIKKIIYFRIVPSLLAITAFIFLLNQNSFLIKKIKITGNEYLDNKKINFILDSKMSGKNSFFISNNNFIFYPESKIKESLKKEFIEIDDIDISYKSLFKYNSIEINIKQKEKKYIWCDKNNKKCNFVSARGMIMDEFEIENGRGKKDYIIFYGDFEKKINNKKKDEIYVNGKNFIDLEKYIKEFKNIGFEIKEVNKIYFGDYIFKNKDNARLIIPQKFSKDIIFNFKDVSSFKDIGFDKKNGVFESDIAYINFLFGNSIVYCLKDDECSGNY